MVLYCTFFFKFNFVQSVSYSSGTTKRLPDANISKNFNKIIELLKLKTPV